MAGRLGRVHWQMGQTLLPEHFIAQENSLLDEMHRRFQLSGPPVFGIGRLEWNEALLAEGVFSVQELSLVLPSGRLLDVPGNATISPFNLNIVGTTRVSIFLHHLRQEDNGAVDTTGESVPRVIHTLELSADQAAPAAVHSLKLAEFEKSPEENWTLSDRYIPPLLKVGTSPFLRSELESLDGQLEQFHQNLVKEITASYLSGESLFSAKRCLGALLSFRRMIANLKKEVQPHPYDLYERLAEFHTEVCLYRNATPASVTAPYLHEQLAVCFSRLITPLLEELKMERAPAPYLPFEQKNGMFIVPELPSACRSAEQIYFLLQKERVADDLELDSLKLGSRDRVPAIHQHALRGIPYVPIERPPFQHPFGAEVDFYRIEEGEEWDRALRDGSLAFFSSPELESVEAFLYWR